MIPIEFLPNLWVTEPSGLEGQGSGFLMAENIREIFSVDVKVPYSKDFLRSWVITPITSQELEKEQYLKALSRLIIESWLEKGNIIIVGSIFSIQIILKQVLYDYGGIRENKNIMKVIQSKLGE